MTQRLTRPITVAVLADAPSVELGLDVIENAGRLPARFRIEYDRDLIVSGNEYSLSAEVRHGDDLLYVNDTVHLVLTRVWSMSMRICSQTQR